VRPELLDELSPDDPRAQASRRDLVTLNAVMAHARTVAGVLRSAFDQTPPRSLIELGAGDGRFLLGVARRLASDWPGVSVALLDQQNLVPADRLAEFQELGWHAEVIRADVFEWIRQPSGTTYDGLIANLFFHHFSTEQLSKLLGECARRTKVFFALEPRRALLPLMLSRCVGLLGCNSVTRHDAPASVRAGFVGKELSRLWPDDAGWFLQERPVGLFSHLFLGARADWPARRRRSLG
jgi:hypothetical protein